MPCPTDCKLLHTNIIPRVTVVLIDRASRQRHEPIVKCLNQGRVGEDAIPQCGVGQFADHCDL